MVVSVSWQNPSLWRVSDSSKKNPSTRWPLILHKKENLVCGGLWFFINLVCGDIWFSKKILVYGGILRILRSRSRVKLKFVTWNRICPGSAWIHDRQNFEQCRCGMLLCKNVETAGVILVKLNNLSDFLGIFLRRCLSKLKISSCSFLLARAWFRALVAGVMMQFLIIVIAKQY